MASRPAIHNECEDIAAEIRALMREHPGFTLTSDSGHIIVGCYYDKGDGDIPVIDVRL